MSRRADLRGSTLRDGIRSTCPVSIHVLLVCLLAAILLGALTTGIATAQPDPGSANVSYAERSVSPETGHFGDVVTGTVTATNTGPTAAPYNVSLAVDGRVVAWENGTLDAGNETTVRLRWTPRRVGSSEVAVAGAPTETVTIRNAWPAAGRDPGATGVDPTATDDVIGVEVYSEAEIRPFATQPAVRNGTTYYGSGATGMFYAEGVPGPTTLVAANATTGTIEWSFAVGSDNTLESSGRSTPSLAGDTAYLRSTGLEAGLYAVNLSDGTERWSASLSDGTAAATAVDGRVFATGGNGEPGDSPPSLVAFDSNGTELWRNETIGTLDVTPVAADGAVVVGTPSGTVYTFDAATGTPRWSTTLGSSSVGRVAARNGTVYATSGTNLTALDAADGGERWRHDLGANATGPPAVAADAAFVPTDRGLQAVNATAEPVPEGARELWRGEWTGGSATAPTVASGYVAVGLANGTVLARDVADGSPVWRHDFGDATPTAPTVHDGRVYVGLGVGYGIAVLEEVHADETLLRVGNERVSPTRLDAGSSVTASVEVTNHGGAPGEFSVPVSVGGGTVVRENGTLGSPGQSVVARLEGTIAGQTTKTVSTQVSDLRPGVRRIRVGTASRVDVEVADPWSEWRATLDGEVVALERHDGVAYAATENRTLYALEAGTVAWQTSFHDVVEDREPLFPSLVATDAGVILTSRSSSLYGYDPATGTESWNASLDGSLVALAAGEEGHVHAGVDAHHGNTTVRVLDASNGTTVRSISVNGSVEAVAGPRDGTLYVARERATGSWEAAAVDVATGTVDWNRSLDAEAALSGPARGRLLVSTENSTAVALDAANGTVRWTRGFDAPALGRLVPSGEDALAVRYGDRLSVSDLDELLRFDGASGAVERTWDEFVATGAPTTRDGTALITADPGVLHAVRTSDGSHRWSFVTAGQTDAGAVLVDGTAVVPAGRTIYGVTGPPTGPENGPEPGDDDGSTLPASGPALEVVDLSVPPARPTTDDRVSIEVDVRNDGADTAERQLPVRVDGTVVERQSLALAPGEGRSFTVHRRFGTPGTYVVTAGEERHEVVVDRAPPPDSGDDSENDTGPGTATLDADATSENGSRNRSAGEEGASDDSQPGFGALAAVVALLLAVALRAAPSGAGR